MTYTSEVSSARHRSRGPLLTLGAVLVGAVTVALVALVVQNSEDVSVRWLVVDGQQPLWAVLAITAAAGVALAELIGFVWHHRDRRR